MAGLRSVPPSERRSKAPAGPAEAAGDAALMRQAGSDQAWSLAAAARHPRDAATTPPGVPRASPDLPCRGDVIIMFQRPLQRTRWKMIRYLRVQVWSLRALVWLAAFLPITAAAFDCSKAGTAVEKLICNDPILTSLDESLNAAYRAILVTHENDKAVRVEQRRWLKDVRNACADADCLRAAYSDRVSDIERDVHEHPEAATCGIKTPERPGGHCPVSVVCGRNRDDSIIQAVADQCVGADRHDIDVYYYADRHAPATLLTKLTDQQMREMYLSERDPFGYVQLDILVGCGVGPNCFHDLYRFDPRARTLYHFYSGGYSELLYFDGYLVESGRASAASWEYHAYKMRRQGHREVVDRNFIMISVWMDGFYGDEEESKQPDEENCSFSAVRENAGELRSRPVKPPNRRWLKFCRHYLDD